MATGHISDGISLGAVTRIIPPLEGELNLQHWKAMIIKALDLLQLKKYIESSIPCPPNSDAHERWRSERGIVALIIESSFSRIRDRLTDNGLPINEPDPFVMFRQTCAVFDKYGSFDGARLYKRLMNIRRPDYESTRLYCLEIRRLRSRMIEIGQCDDVFILEQVFNNLQHFCPVDVLGRLQRKFEKGDLTFDETVEAMLEWEKGSVIKPAPAPLLPAHTHFPGRDSAVDPMRNSWASSSVGTQVRRD
ncbi:hypothetical protein UCDDA912_g02885 [Diaporthe ampelina]|uniref:Uncharacterized protein n=1 Tax=Diaporthe ampelina TaxID=1214573 RepID=A0A0G2FT45_9PEZI|nr:hypothetical protein UCDDA912_g02885 [Diaporthe ampelina]